MSTCTVRCLQSNQITSGLVNVLLIHCVTFIVHALNTNALLTITLNLIRMHTHYKQWQAITALVNMTHTIT